MMKHYLIDFENVKGGGLYGIERLTEEDHVIVLYTRNANTISIGEHLTLMQCKCKLDFIELLHLGKNALDFQLVMMLGVLGGRHENESPEFYIISGDTGYDVITEMNAILGLHAKIIRCRTIAEAIDINTTRERRRGSGERRNRQQSRAGRGRCAGGDASSDAGSVSLYYGGLGSRNGTGSAAGTVRMHACCRRFFL